MQEESLRSNGARVNVSTFDYSVTNHLNAMDKISKLCGEVEFDQLDESEIQRLSSSITFLREWKHYTYEPRIVSFACEMGGSTADKEVVNDILLPQFSSAAVVHSKTPSGNASSLESSKDFVMYVGGSIWALDWCPRVHELPDGHMRCEFVAVAAHPPDSYYHKIGVPQTGRGIVQIWSILNASSNEGQVLPPKKNLKQRSKKNEPAEGESTQLKRPRGRPRKKPIEESLDNDATKGNPEQPKRPRGRPTQLKRPRGRPRKKPIEESLDNDATKGNPEQPKRPRGRPRKKPVGESLDNLDGNNQLSQAAAIQNPEDTLIPIAIEDGLLHTQENSVPDKQDKKKQEMSSSSNSAVKLPIRSRKSKVRAGSGSDTKLLGQNGSTETPSLKCQGHLSTGHDSFVSENLLNGCSSDAGLSSCSIPEDIALPRVVVCLAHNGKVAWDVKWRPYTLGDSCKYQIGYLAVLLGNGSLEVWEVPHPQTMKAIYSSSGRVGTDPRFVKLEPVFRCSMLKCGGTQSIPLTVEWSSLARPDFLLAGCHDGTVAMWKFSTNSLSEDRRPLICFTADTVPIRAVAWAPVESDLESANVILTAGHGGLKFWDIRDPFRPLWTVHPAPRFIYSLDWLPDPRCVIITFDDGTIRILSLGKAACDVPVTGKPFTGTKQQGLSAYICSSFAIWSAQVSRLTGMVAYCSADGTVLHFQLTKKAVEKDPSRHRAPHFLCGSLTEEGSTITVRTPLPDNPLTLKKSVNDCGEAPKSLRSFLTESLQAKSTNEKKSKNPAFDNRIESICFDDDPDVESGPEETPRARKGSTSSSSKKAKDDQASACIVAEGTDVQGKESRKGEAGNEIEVFPPKLVAMHRVRWNMNKGSERWLCYGGAAGIVRCQEIRIPDSCKKYARKGGNWN